MGALVAAIVAGLGWWVWGSAGSSATISTSGATSPMSQQILSTLGQLHTIKLDPGIFKDPVFMSLTDFGVSIPPQQAGRRNPFAPVGK